MVGREKRRVRLWWVIVLGVLGVFALGVGLAGIGVRYLWESNKKPPMSRVIAIRQVGIRLPEGAGDFEFHREAMFNEFVRIRFSMPAEQLEAFFAANPELPSGNEPQMRWKSVAPLPAPTDLKWWNPGDMEEPRSARSSRLVTLGGSDWTRDWLIEWGKRQGRVWVYVLRIEQPGDVRPEEDREGAKPAEDVN